MKLQTIKSDKYDMIYFPEDMIRLRQEVYFKLLDINANYSIVIQLLLPTLLEVAKFIEENEKNYSHFNWGIVLETIKEPRVTNSFIGKQSGLIGQEPLNDQKIIAILKQMLTRMQKKKGKS